MANDTNHCSEHEKFQYKCLECCRQYQRWHYQQNKETYAKKHKEWYQENKEEHKVNTRGKHRKRRYGVSQERFDQMLQEQQHTCAICGTVMGQEACVDHDHTTGRVRGLLCKTCNAGLGLFHDNWQIISSALNYLERNQ